jgi:hypothetical protein
MFIDLLSMTGLGGIRGAMDPTCGINRREEVIGINKVSQKGAHLFSS